MSEATTPPVLTESQFALLKRIDRRAGAGCPLTYREAVDITGVCSPVDLAGLSIPRLIGFRGTARRIYPTPAGQAALIAGRFTKPCFADGCPNTFVVEGDEDESFCSEQCEEEQGAREAGENLHDKMQEGDFDG